MLDFIKLTQRLIFGKSILLNNRFRVVTFQRDKNPFSFILSLAACENSFTDFSIKNMQGGIMAAKKIFLLLVISICILVVNSCKEDNPVSPEDQLVGTWVLTKLTMTSQGQTIVQTPAEAGVQVTLIIRSNKTYQMTQTDQSGTVTETGTWSATDKEISAKSSDGKIEVIPYILAGNKLSLTVQIAIETGGNKFPVIMEFTKQ